MKKWVYGTLQICGVIFLIQLVFIIVISSCVIVNPEGVTKALAQYLIKEDALVKSDAIVVIGGYENEKRFDYGIELYKQGYGNKMIVSGAGDDSYVINYMTSHGMKKEDLFIDRLAATTDENAVYVKKLVDANHIRSFILVTSPDQSRRARQVFDNAFKNSGVKILSSSNKDSEFKPEELMNNKNAKQQLVMEWTKYIYYKLK